MSDFSDPHIAIMLFGEYAAQQIDQEFGEDKDITSIFFIGFDLGRRVMREYPEWMTKLMDNYTAQMPVDFDERDVNARINKVIDFIVGKCPQK